MDYFKKAGDLTEDTSKGNDTYFKQAGDLTEYTSKGNDTYFKQAGDLTEYTQKGNKTIFKQESRKLNPVGIKREDKTKELGADINQYIKSIVSGKRYEYESELGTVVSGGSIIVSFNRLKEMVAEGCYNFISARYINPKAIAIEFQQIDKTIGKIR